MTPDPGGCMPTTLILAALAGLFIRLRLRRTRK
jgi:hypothetical protein